VQAARESARRSSCQNNFRQAGLAYLNDAQSKKDAFAPRMVSDQTKSAGWGVFLLPFLESSELFKKYSFSAPFFYSQPAYGIDNQSVTNTRIETFLCASAPQRTAPYSYTFSYPGYPSMTWQAFPADLTPLASVDANLATYLGLTITGDQLKAALDSDTRTSLAKLTDGTSKTALLFEAAGKNDLWRAGNRTGQQLSGFFAGQGGWNDSTSGGSVLWGSSSDGATGPGAFGVNCSNDYGLYAFHPAGANVVMADGSVRFLAAVIDIRILVAVVTRSGSEITHTDN
jgi:prepilin-type processing-associated H-X9-DG protein